MKACRHANELPWAIHIVAVECCGFLPTVLKCQKHLHLIARARILRFMPYKVVGFLAFADMLLTKLLNHPLWLLYASQTVAPVSIPIEQCGPFRPIYTDPIHGPTSCAFIHCFCVVQFFIILFPFDSPVQRHVFSFEFAFSSCFQAHLHFC